MEKNFFACVNSVDGYYEELQNDNLNDLLTSVVEILKTSGGHAKIYTFFEEMEVERVHKMD